MINSVIVIPARYHSTRFPGKPLHKIAGKTMLHRVFDVAKRATEALDNIEILVATDDERIVQHASSIGAQAVMTPSDCKTGSDRALAACQQLTRRPELIINLQGDAPMTPPEFLKAILLALLDNPDVDVATPVVPLSWQQLDEFRQAKQTRAFSGTTAVIADDGQALWFSKQILPAIRDEESLRQQSPNSPVFRHVGLYGYRYEALKRFVALPEGHYEALEGLEQLRMLEHGMRIQAVKVNCPPCFNHPGVDTLEDALCAERMLQEFTNA